MSLCRHYVRGLRRSVLVDTPDAETKSKRSSAILHDYNDPRDDSLAGPSTYFTERKSTPDQRLSAFLRDDGKKTHSPSHSQGGNSNHSNEHTNTTASERPPRPSFMTSNNSGSNGHSNSNQSPAPDSTSPGNAVSRADIRSSAEKILYTYLLAGSEREIILPVGILDQITDAIEREGRDDPEVFDAAKDYVFQAMERDAFPGFLRHKALGNIVQPSMMLRLIVGLVALFAALWTAFVLIFLDYSRQTRCWVRAISVVLVPLSMLTLFTAHPPVRSRSLLPRFAPIHARPRARIHGPLRVHIHVVPAHQGAVRAEIAQQARAHVSGRHRARHGCALLSLHPGAWEEVMRDRA